ncbi:hypothetical protein [Cupriavidus sp. UYPR2.512]|uniref:hypothetical protein n=1 Tax=Cupriavidus sp. UYPR2.512 TaxID=1080187 RepID=UPI00036168ED|nr:hypothetical protein [Cupriavidus sp. UYPR2.512]UIF89382.1 hypothetical protein KAF44_29285 [Cupriavidus necator]
MKNGNSPQQLNQSLGSSFTYDQVDMVIVAPDGTRFDQADILRMQRPTCSFQEPSAEFYRWYEFGGTARERPLDAAELSALLVTQCGYSNEVADECVRLESQARDGDKAVWHAIAEYRQERLHADTPREKPSAYDSVQEQLADARPLPKDVALIKWGGFKDSAIEGGFGSQQQRIAGLIKAGATKAQLIQFWRETKHLNWPASFGQSPWETASSVGGALDAALLGGALSAYHHGLLYVFGRTQAAARVGPERDVTQKNDQRRPKM